ncbi:carbamoyl-phosphate-synthetase [Lachnospiraceae bacterium WCA-9-b2]|uniref:Carbamoyl-phosphate-synthetase n=1 Tax=Sporofaciens musculi TaxID=2681861 RepID=A0A7X3SIN8_9FIRM|nr:carbamoyl-phosphate-synthetase [Sporofaciens musculi]MXP75565.1 carbamoyl-phosphate-synthetase [Sporofaciens musculi]
MNNEAKESKDSREVKVAKETREFEGKKLLILGGNPETIPLVEIANNWGIKTIVVSARHTDPAKTYAWKAYDFEGLDTGAVIKIATEEKVDGVLVGVADILVPMYCKVCEALDLPCYATQEIVDVFSFKDVFKSTCERYGVHGIPEFYLDSSMNPEDLAKIQFPVMVKPVDNGGGVGMTVAYNEEELRKGVTVALENSRTKRFIVEKYMQCEDMGMYYTFKDGYCSVSCIYDRYTTDEQPGLSRVCLGGTYPSKHLDEYFERMHPNALRLFREIGIKNGVLMLSGFYENGEFYVYDTGFRLQGEAPHLLMKAIHGFDQREMLIRFALTGSEGDVELKMEDDTRLRGKWAATLWFLLKEGRIAKIEGLDRLDQDERVVANIQRLHEGDTVLPEWIGNEKQVLTRMYLICNSRMELADTLKYYMNTVKVLDEEGNNLLLKGFDVNKALELK